ncbi:O-antigen ligase family protein [Piscinibacter sp. XHJ-5]|uniref:O-antigen ligase family protein n=1 Tax=Piscinibacter sp. XHJ-5 TaxID=3037797 RepID=UPI00245288BA|nr:O-antigen ligase family protein [Piscinibacter sp. XHJ-5]
MYNLKTLVVVLGIALPMFWFIRPFVERFIAPEDFARRRNVWIVLTLTAFLSPSFWLYAVVALTLCAWAGRKDSNPPALTVLLLQVIPPIGLYIPMVGINQLFQLNNYRILSLAVLLPLAVQLLHAPKQDVPPLRKWIDGLLIGFMLLQLVLLMPYESFTNTLRRGFLLVLDVWLVYYVFSRFCRTRAAIMDVCVTLCVACAIFVPIAAFETLKGWLLYQGLGEVWGKPLEFAFLLRGDSLRAQASVGHSLALGYVLAVGFGLALFLGGQLRSRRATFAMGAWMWLGLIAAYSRGPWLVAVVAYFSYAALQPDGLSRFIKNGAVAVAIAALILVSPVGERVIDTLPFIGTVDAANVTYRQRLAEVSWQLIQQNPWFGNPFVLTQMEELRQGQGIIDLVNSYASVALLYGLVGLGLFLGVFFAGMGGLYRLSRRWRDDDPDTALLGAALLTAMVATLFMMATGSFGTILAQLYWVLAGLAAAYAGLSFADERVATAAVPEWPHAVQPATFSPRSAFRVGK